MYIRIYVLIKRYMIIMYTYISIYIYSLCILLLSLSLYIYLVPIPYEILPLIEIYTLFIRLWGISYSPCNPNLAVPQGTLKAYARLCSLRYISVAIYCLYHLYHHLTVWCYLWYLLLFVY